MQDNSTTCKHIVDFVVFVVNQFNSIVRTIMGDNGIEFAMNDFLLYQRHYTSNHLC